MKPRIRKFSIKDIKVRVEIDYAKLAHAITQSSLRSEIEPVKPVKKDSLRLKVMKWCNGTIYIGLSIMSVGRVRNVWSSYISQTTKTTIDFVNSVVFSGLYIVIAVLSFLSQQESFDDNTEDTEKYFNANIAFLALILAIISFME